MAARDSNSGTLLADLEERARGKLDRATWDYIAGGAGDELTLRENIAAFSRLHFRPRVLRGVSEPDRSTSVLGRALRSAVQLAPIGHLRLAHPDGEIAAARAARATSSLFVLSTMSSVPIEEVAHASGEHSFWFQVYVFRDRSVTAELVQRAAAAGSSALVLTVDTPRIAPRDRDDRNGFTLPPAVETLNLPKHARVETIAGHAKSWFEPALSWDVVAWLATLGTGLPIVIKGILTAEDARLAIEHGAAGVLVSNHGGRQLDSTPATIDVLPEIVDAVGERGEVYLDGGVRRGIDVVKAFARGARAVFVGRPYVWGLALGGEQGVVDVIGRFDEEVGTALALLGCASLRELDGRFVR